MAAREEEAAVQADAYIDSLLATRARLPVALADGAAQPRPEVQRVAELLEAGLPRFHPSFLFEETLATRLRATAAGMAAAAAVTDEVAPRTQAEVVALPRPTGLPAPIVTVLHRRRLVGGAIASGVSLAGAAMLVRAAQHRRGRGRSRREWLS